MWGASWRRAALAFGAGVLALGVTGAPATGAVAHAGRAPAEIDGRLLMAHGDDFGTGHTRMSYGLRTAHGDLQLRIPASQARRFHDLANRRVRVRGTRHTLALAAESVIPIDAP